MTTNSKKRPFATFMDNWLIRGPSNTSISKKAKKKHHHHHVAPEKSSPEAYVADLKRFIKKYKKKIVYLKIIDSVPEEDIDEDTSKWTRELLDDHCRIIMLTQDREDQLVYVESLVLEEVEPGLSLPSEESFHHDVIQGWNACKEKMYRKSAANKLDILIAFTSTLRDHNSWMQGGADEEDNTLIKAMVQELASQWKRLLKTKDKTLGWDVEYTKPGVFSLLEQFKSMIEADDGYYGFVNFDYE